MNFVGSFVSTGLSFGSAYNTARLRKYAKENIGQSFELRPRVPESRKQRGFYEGAVIGLWIYLDGNDYRDSRIHKHYHHEANKEFNGEIIIRGGKTEKIGKSSKGILNGGHVERVMAYLDENYGVDTATLCDPEKYKYFRDVIYATGEYDTYLDYLKSLNILK